MKRVLNILLLFAMAASLSSCFKEDEMVLPHRPGESLTDTVAMTNYYKYQVYYSLKENKEVKIQSRSSWDLAFVSAPGGWQVVPNSSCFMKVAVLPGQAFGSVPDTVGAKWNFNPSDGSSDTTAIPRWFEVAGNDTVGKKQLIIIDRGMDDIGNMRGLRQLSIDSLSNGIFYFRIAAYKGTGAQSYRVAKKPGTNYTLFSIATPTLELSEPAATDWCLLFTQYTTLLFTDAGEPYPYLVTGVLLNKSGVEVAVDTSNAYASINFERAQKMTFSKQNDLIGYEWKHYDFDTGSYTVTSDNTYVIRDAQGFYYKLRFTGFYNTKGEKGFPSFEYQLL